ncbi:stabilizer of axonemal microtubules 4 [Pogoniulus pusillus]|uniref:stabilizer of axonemal microtubules 4 n=1 Tax=Pogoniulus pusillus TaxID=488313 RepID=UPI0030B92D4E
MACPFVCPRGKLRSLPPGLATGFPSPKVETGGSSELMNFYTTSYMVAHVSFLLSPGQPRFRPRLGHHTGAGFVPNSCSALSYLLCPRSTSEACCQDIATSTTTKHFKPFWLPDGSSVLPRRVHQPGSGYLQECPPACLYTGRLSPQHAGVLQGSPKTSREHGTEKHHTGPAQPGVSLGVLVAMGLAPSPGEFPGGFGGAGGHETSSIHMRVWGCWWPWDQLQSWEGLVVLGLAPSSGGLRGAGGHETTSDPRSSWGCQSALPGNSETASGAELGTGDSPGGSPWPLPHLLPTGILQKTTIGAKEQSGFTRAIPGSNAILPALPGQPLGVSVTRMDYVPSVHSHGRETLAALPAGSERGSGFSREVPGSLGTAVSRIPSHCLTPRVLLVLMPIAPTQGLQAPRVTLSSLLGHQTVGRMVGGGTALSPPLLPSLSLCPCTQPTSLLQEPSGFSTNYSQNITLGPALSPTAPAPPCRDPSWTARPMGGIQPQRPSGFSTNNHSTGLGGTVGHLLA